MKLSSVGCNKFNLSNTEYLFDIYTRYATKCNICNLVTLSNIGVYRRIFESGLAKQYIVFDEGFIAIKSLCKQYKNVEFVEINIKNLISKIEGKNMKADLTIGNPPFTLGGKATQPLYAEIACKIFKHTKRIIWICPTSWTHKIEYDVSKEKYRKELEQYFVSCDLVDPEEFGISITDKLGIYVLDENNTKLAPFDEWKFYNCKNPALTKSILNKVKKYSKDNLQNHYHKKEGKFIVQAAQCRGNVGKWDWTTFFDEKNKKMILTDFDKITNDRYNWWTFNSKNECEVFKNFTETDIFMFILYSYKTGLPQPLNKLPWMESYKNDIDDKYLTKYFNLTKEEIDYIHEEMKNFGWKAKGKK